MQDKEMKSARSDRIQLLVTPQEKALLMRAAAIEQLDMTSFIMRVALEAAQEVVKREEHIILSERDTLFVLDLLENPPPANAKLIAAANAWKDNQMQLATGAN